MQNHIENRLANKNLRIDIIHSCILLLNDRLKACSYMDKIKE